VARAGFGGAGGGCAGLVAVGGVVRRQRAVRVAAVQERPRRRRAEEERDDVGQAQRRRAVRRRAVARLVQRGEQARRRRRHGVVAAAAAAQEEGRQVPPQAPGGGARGARRARGRRRRAGVHAEGRAGRAQPDLGERRDDAADLALRPAAAALRAMLGGFAGESWEGRWTEEQCALAAVHPAEEASFWEEHLDVVGALADDETEASSGDLRAPVWIALRNRNRLLRNSRVYGSSSYASYH
jgi:hypothetical protein